MPRKHDAEEVMDLTLVDPRRGEEIRDGRGARAVPREANREGDDDTMGPGQVVEEFKRRATIQGTDSDEAVAAEHHLGDRDGIADLVGGGLHPDTVGADLFGRPELL